MTKMTKAERKAEKEKIKKMSFKEKREYYKSKRIGWRKGWYIIKWILAGFAAFVVTCLIIMIVQLNTESKTITKAVHKAEAKATATATSGGLKLTVLNGIHVKNSEPISAELTNLTDKPMNIVTGETTDPIGKGFGLLSDQEMKMGENDDLIIKPHQTLKFTYGVGEGRKYGGKYRIAAGLWDDKTQTSKDVVEVKFDSKK